MTDNNTGCDYISIHALREEGDGIKTILRTLFGDFYPRPPRGGRLIFNRDVLINEGISIHALREEGDKSLTVISRSPLYFYPRPPRGGRRLHHQPCEP